MNGKSTIQIYTGNGKGKTTAAIGLAVRSAGAGKKVFIGQFVKLQTSSEIEEIRKCIPNITTRQYGTGSFIVCTPSPDEIAAAQEGLAEVTSIIYSGEYDVVILDELNIALYYQMIQVAEIVNMLNNRPDHVEVIITGRNAPDELVELADLVTEMKEVKHYFSKGIEARKGIEY